MASESRTSLEGPVEVIGVLMSLAMAATKPQEMTARIMRPFLLFSAALTKCHSHNFFVSRCTEWRERERREKKRREHDPEDIEEQWRRQRGVAQIRSILVTATCKLFRGRDYN
jgi:hypothetical protein